MNNFSGTHMRSRRNLLDLNNFAPIHFSASSYSTEVQTKSDIMKHTLGNELLLNNFHLLSDPLKKNLADSVITCETKNTMVETTDYKKNEAVKPPTTQRTDYYPSLAGITNFFAGVFNIMGTIFQKRASSPVPQYYDCYDKEYNEGQMAPPIYWQPSNFEVQNKNEEADIPFGSTNESHTNLDVEMSADCKTAATQCEEKLNQVRLLLSNKNDQNIPKIRNKQRKPKKTFVEAGSVEENFEEAFSEIGIVSLSNETFIECCTPFNYHDELLIQSDAPRIKTDFYLEESMDITKSISEKTEYKKTEVKQNLNTKNHSNDDISITRTKDELISSCEDKLNRLKALLQPRHTKTHKKTEPIPISKENEIETVFGNEINTSDILNSSDSQNSDHFDEVTGRFNSSSVDSEDSFQIVFTDSPKNFRRRIPSECESEDSFIVFEESPDSCYTSNDVFGEEILDNESSDSDSDSDIDDDFGCAVQCKLSPSLSRTFGDLTDDSLYGQDVVDSAPVSLPSVTTQSMKEKTGLLLDEMKKYEKKKQPPKRVHFSTEPPKVHVMRVWAFAARQARAGHWERHALDRERFRRRIADVEMAISWVLKPQHRTRIVFQRFMPWWNAQKRKELAEKKATEEREKRRMEEEGKNNGFAENSNSCDNIVPEVVENRRNDPHLNRDENNLANDSVENNNETEKNEVSQNILNIDNKTKLIQNQNYRDQDVVNSQFNDSNDIIENNNEINDSILAKINEESLIKNGFINIKDCCNDT